MFMLYSRWGGEDTDSENGKAKRSKYNRPCLIHCLWKMASTMAEPKWYRLNPPSIYSEIILIDFLRLLSAAVLCNRRSYNYAVELPHLDRLNFTTG
jgi:hypothetical protein